MFDHGAVRALERIGEAVTEESDDRELALKEAYVQGDFARLRKAARALSEDASQSDSVRANARMWLERVSVDVVTCGLLVFALAVFCAIVLRYAL